MKDFVHSIRFKILIGLLVVLLGFMVRAIYTGGTAPLFSQVIGIVTVPIQRVTSNITNHVTEFFDQFLRASATYEQNARLQEEVNELRKRVVEYDRMKHENEQFRRIIGIKEKRPDLSFEIASVIARDPANRFYSVTIDKGKLDGIAYMDPVITADGLVGYISEVGLHSSKIRTILDVSIDVGAFDSTTRDIGILTGSIDLVEQGLCRLDYLPRDSKAKAGDLVLTSGGSLFPKDIIIGEIVSVDTNSHGTSLAAIVRPAADVQGMKDVVVITQFEGQGEM